MHKKNKNIHLLQVMCTYICTYILYMCVCMGVAFAIYYTVRIDVIVALFCLLRFLVLEKNLFIFSFDIIFISFTMASSAYFHNFCLAYCCKVLVRALPIYL